MTELLREPRPTHAMIAAQVSKALLQNERARIYKWHKKTGKYPPRRRPAA